MSALRLVCFPPAGSSVAVFRAWGPLAPHVVVDAQELPGRGGGAVPGECSTLADAAELHARRLTALLDPEQPWALWGHSLGGLLAFEVAQRMCAPGRPRPRFVAVAGSRPPHRSLGPVFAPLLDRDDEALLDGLATLGAVNPALRTSPLRRLFLPALRRDLRLLSSYAPAARRPRLPVDLLAWHGRDDALVPPPVGSEWAGYTSARFGERTFAGGHFFPTDALADVRSALAALGRAYGAATAQLPTPRAAMCAGG